MKCYELPGGENEDDLELLVAPESDSDTEACTTDDELSDDDKSSSGGESEENENGKSDGIVLYLSKPGTSFWDTWSPKLPNDPLPPGVPWSQLAFPPDNFDLDYSLPDVSDQHVPTRVHWDQDSPPRDCLNQYAPQRVNWDQDSSPSDCFTMPPPFRVPLNQDSPPRDHWSHLIQNSPPRDYYRYNAPPRVPLSQNSNSRNRLNRDLLSTTLPRPLFHDMIYNRDEFLARQNNPNHRRNFEAASNVYQSYLDIVEEADNERLATNATEFFRNRN